MRTVVSVSMTPELAARLRDSAVGRGQTFSARVVELLLAGEEATEPRKTSSGEGMFGSLDHLFAKTEEEALDDADASVSEPLERVPEDDGGNKGHGPELVETPTTPSTSSAQTAAERVYACITTKRQSLSEIASSANVSEDEAEQILDDLVNRDNEPILPKLIAGEWFFSLIG